MRILFVLAIVFLTLTCVKAQNPVANKAVDSTKNQIEKLEEKEEVNEGKIAGRRAFHRALIFPGFGQIYNYSLVVKDVKSGAVPGKKIGQKIYILTKLGALYAGGTMLVMSYSDNRSLYREVLAELQYRQINKEPDPNGRFINYTNTEQLNVAKNIYKRNSQIVLISFVGLYAISAIDAYVATRLKYFNIEDKLAIRFSPSMINSQTMYGFSPTPALKLSLKF